MVSLNRYFIFWPVVPRPGRVGSFLCSRACEAVIYYAARKRVQSRQRVWERTVCPIYGSSMASRSSSTVKMWSREWQAAHLPPLGCEPLRQSNRLCSPMSADLHKIPAGALRHDRPDCPGVECACPPSPMAASSYSGAGWTFPNQWKPWNTYWRGRNAMKPLLHEPIISRKFRVPPKLLCPDTPFTPDNRSIPRRDFPTTTSHTQSTTRSSRPATRSSGAHHHHHHHHPGMWPGPGHLFHHHQARGQQARGQQGRGHGEHQQGTIAKKREACGAQQARMAPRVDRGRTTR